MLQIFNNHQRCPLPYNGKGHFGVTGGMRTLPALT